MKPYVYTVVGGHGASFRCAELLRQSLDVWNAGKYDWATYTAPACLRPYAGVHKLMIDLPPGRPCYLYLDADVLFLDSLDLACASITNNIADLAVAFERQPMTNCWFRYPHASPANVRIMARRRGINGGSFAFRDPEFLYRAFDLFRRATRRPPVPGEVAKSAALEQSAINYAWLTGNYRTWTFDVEFRPERSTQSRGIFHFLGGAGNMADKLLRMQRFLETHDGKESSDQTSANASQVDAAGDEPDRRGQG